MSNIIFCLMGPTASGKTGLACELMTQFPLEIISVDSAMIYRGMDIGTAKPSSQELAKAPHHLIDIKNPIEAYSAAQFCSDVAVLCDSIYKKGNIPLLVGGTMMYFNALQKGLSVLPEANEAMRDKMEQEADQYGWPFMHEQLQRVDSSTAERIHPHDAQRIQRALEVYYLTGTPLSVFLQQEQKQIAPYQFINMALFPQNRAWLHERIALRFDDMLAHGFVDEVRCLREKWPLDGGMPSMRCVGYRQIFDYLEGSYDYSLLRDKGVAATRQLAKRQLTWLRHWDNINLYDPQKAAFSQEIIAKMGEILDNSCS